VSGSKGSKDDAMSCASPFKQHDTNDWITAYIVPSSPFLTSALRDARLEKFVTS